MYLKATYTLNIFIAYHPSDQAHYEEMVKQLAILDAKNAGYIINRVGYDGTDKSPDSEATIQSLISGADLILLLMSEKAILSPFFASEELRASILQHQRNQSIVVPIILSTCWWEDTPFKQLSVLPRAGLPIYDSANIKNELYAQVIDTLDEKLARIRARKLELEEQFNAKIAEANAIFDRWETDPSQLRAVLPIYQNALQYWREGFSPDYKIIEARIDVCHREIDFQHYSKAAFDAYKAKDLQTCYFNCKDALALRDDAVVRRLFQRVKTQLNEAAFQEQKAPFDSYIQVADAAFLDLDWAVAKAAYLQALEHHLPNCTPSRNNIQHKIELCGREEEMEIAQREAQRLYRLQDYQRMSSLLLNHVQSIHHDSLYQMERALQLLDLLDVAVPFFEERSRRWGFLNEATQTIIIAPKYTAAYHFSEHLAGVKKWDNWGFIDIEGNEIIPFIYQYVSHFQNGIAQVIHQGETYCINRKGERVEADVKEVEVPLNKVPKAALPPTQHLTRFPKKKE